MLTLATIAAIQQNKLPINRTTLKLIAIITMVIDHIGAILFPHIMAFRWIGRIAFPIFVYQLVEGYEHTSNLKKYFGRLALFAIISEITFDLAIFGQPFYWEAQNIYFELILALLAIYLLDKSKKVNIIVRWLVIFAICMTAILMRTDYQAYGIFLAILFYQFKNDFLVYAIGMPILAYVFNGPVQMFSLLALPILYLYVTKQGNEVQKKFSKPVQFLMYSFYPLHLIVLYAIKMLIR